ncbi:hypothetical protein AAEU42_00055 [Pseudoflavonifractor phocaeensis]|uniref:hypothetical protein n=1 Tax=Pseudoflavonifractor phocaeensis TaxID=1870988 RepID=UPI00308F6771|nr:hypothetical protein CE91St43_05550 [Oscillospiraceae bacterium]
MSRSEVQTYNDGLVTICDVDNVGEAGFRPVKGLVKKCALRYQERTVGVTRFYAAKAAQARVDRVIRVPRCGVLKTDQVAILGSGDQYIIVQVQYPAAVRPLSIDLSLRTVEDGETYDFA